jgi:hypothetical protein
MSEKKFVVIPSMTGTDGEVSVTLSNATFQEKNDSTKTYAHPEFGPWLIEQIYREQKILAVKKGLFKKIYVCPNCSSELNPDLRKSMEISFDLKHLDFSQFNVKITIPSVECPQCKKVCGIDIKGSLDNHLAEALIHAFQSKNIVP